MIGIDRIFFCMFSLCQDLISFIIRMCFTKLRPKNFRIDLLTYIFILDQFRFDDTVGLIAEVILNVIWLLFVAYLRIC